MQRHPCINGLALAASLALAGLASAAATIKPASPPPAKASTAMTGMPVFVQNIAPGAAEAVKAVDGFRTAIKAARLAEVANLMDPQVLIMESGKSQRSRDEYLGGRAPGDAVFLKSAKEQLRYRNAQVEGNVAWVGTESVLEAVKDGQPVLLLTSESMVLKKTAQGWKIVQIHWSSRPAPKS